MMLRTFLLIGCICLAFLAVAADEPPPEVSAETVDGRTISGHLLNPAVRLKNEFGSQEVEAKHIRRITFRPIDSENGRDVVELDDKSHITGQLITVNLTWQTYRTRMFSPWLWAGNT